MLSLVVTAGGVQVETVLKFSDATAGSGIEFAMTCGRAPSSEILEVNGGGVALIDYDNDGDLDVFFANGATMEAPEAGPGSRLYANDGGLKFRDVTASAGVELKRWAMGVAVGDFDADGFDDLYVTCFGPNVLLRNRGGTGFEDMTAKAGVGDDRWGTGCAWGDVDSDGDLDLFVVNYLEFDVQSPPSRAQKAVYKGVPVMRGPHGLVGQRDVLYENRGDGTFRDITAAAGCAEEKPAYGLNTVILDFDGDGRQDIFVANDSMANFLYRGKPGPGATFTDIGLASGIATNGDGSNQASMGLAVADVDGNGRPDLFSTNFSSETNTLHLNIDGRFFEDRTNQHGLGLVSRPFLGWAAGFYDFDLDGDEDLLITNGHVYPEARDHDIDSTYEQAMLLFERSGSRFGRVTDPRAGEVVHRAISGRAAAFGDLDGDGDVDGIVTTLGGPVIVLRNDAPQGDWIAVNLRDARPGAKNRRGVGSRVELTAGGATMRRWVYSGGSFQASSTYTAHFSLPRTSGEGMLTKAVIRVTWPDGKVQTVEDVRPRQRVTVTRD
ncbi:MAG: CRTAC1 family protein [Dehalococcoidia bacterium]|nr:CRTAC1 family protein [Dehalococcoidia bacterium]